MEKKVVITKRFRRNTFRIYQFILKNFSAKTASLFLDKVEERIDLVSKHPLIGKASGKKPNVRSILLSPHNILFYRYQNNKIEILCFA
jgi:plasmid stabilization system protein ParE